MESTKVTRQEGSSRSMRRRKTENTAKNEKTSAKNRVRKSKGINPKNNETSSLDNEIKEKLKPSRKRSQVEEHSVCNTNEQNDLSEKFGMQDSSNTDVTNSVHQKVENNDTEVGNAGTSKNRKRSNKQETSHTSKRQKVLSEVPKLPSKSGKLFVIGENDVGQLGLGESYNAKSRPTEVALTASIVDISAGGMHTVCVTEHGEVLTCGCNDESALGRATSENDSLERILQKVEVPDKVIQVSAGDSHSAALTEDGHVYIWGDFRDSQGAMGLTPEGRQLHPIQILPDDIIVKISSGTEHLVCLTNDGKVYTCGCAENGQLGRITERCSKEGGRKGLACLLNPGLVVVPPYKGREVLFDEIWTGSYSTFVRAKGTGFIYGFGLNNYNQLGFEGQLTRFSPKLLSSFSEKEWLQISGGQHHTLALDKSGKVYSLGRREYGRLGLGEDSEDKSAPTIIPVLQSEKCININCGNLVSFAVTDKGAVYSWGLGTNYQLGHGNDSDVHTPKIITEMLTSLHAFRVSSGGQHTLILAQRRKSAQENGDLKDTL